MCVEVNTHLFHYLHQQVMFWGGFMYLSVCPFLCVQDNSKMMFFFIYVGRDRPSEEVINFLDTSGYKL